MRLSLAMVVVLAGCGAPPLVPQLTGTWVGTALASIKGRAPLSYESRLVVMANGNEADITSICPDGSGTLVATGSGAAADWGGVGTNLECPPLDVEGCVAGVRGGVRMFYRSGGFRLRDDNSLEATVAGTSNWCGVASDATVSFIGRK